jgi:hypothetical protein
MRGLQVTSFTSLVCSVPEDQTSEQSLGDAAVELGALRLSASSLQESSSSTQARVSVSVPRGIHKKLKLLAHDRDITVSTLLLDLIKAEIHGFKAVNP